MTGFSIEKWSRQIFLPSLLIQIAMLLSVHCTVQSISLTSSKYLHVRCAGQTDATAGSVGDLRNLDWSQWYNCTEQSPYVLLPMVSPWLLLVTSLTSPIPLLTVWLCVQSCPVRGCKSFLVFTSYFAYVELCQNEVFVAICWSTNGFVQPHYRANPRKKLVRCPY